MFEKKDVLFSENLGVCYVHDVTKLTDNQGHTINYYVLKNVLDKTKVAYIPVEEHQVLLRPLLSKEEASACYENWKQDEGWKQVKEPFLEEVAYVLGIDWKEFGADE